MSAKCYMKLCEELFEMLQAGQVLCLFLMVWRQEETVLLYLLLKLFNLTFKVCVTCLFLPAGSSRGLVRPGQVELAGIVFLAALYRQT